MEITYTLQAKEDLAYWKKVNNVIILKKIRKLLEVIIETPFEGIGKPEPLRYGLSGAWSGRIDKEHRLVYEVTDELITVLSMKGHY
ncbi:MAG: Txe/YoeB family addiction module toxin [Leadbetterella sp.]|jgi:toxin YoeB|nr:Txe/YoeB family addiction module toxin [Leadbetterella sp.]